MNTWPTIRPDYLAWVRTFPMLAHVGQPGSSPDLPTSDDRPVHQDIEFWSARTHEAEARARHHLSDSEIDTVFNEVAAAVDDDLRRFDPLVACFARYSPDGDPRRIADERATAHAVKRDLAWAAIERATGEAGFFTTLLPVYNEGRWPCAWSGDYPAGHVLFL